MEYRDFLILGIGECIYQRIKSVIKTRNRNSSHQTPGPFQAEAISTNASSSNNDFLEENSTEMSNNISVDDLIRTLTTMTSFQERPQRENSGTGSSSNMNINKLFGMFLAGCRFDTSASGENAKATGIEYVAQKVIINFVRDAARNVNSIPNVEQNSRETFRQRDEEIVDELKEKLGLLQENKTKFICPFISIDNSYHFNDVYVDLPIEMDNSSSTEGQKYRPNRFLISGKYGAGKTIFIFKTIKDIALGMCPLVRNWLRKPIIIYCDLSKFDRQLEEESVHDILMGLCQKYHSAVTEDLLKMFSESIIFFLNGFDFLSEGSKAKVLKFFKRDSIENPSPFCFSTLFLASSFLKATNQFVFDKTITIKGMTIKSSLELVTKIFRGKTMEKNLFLSQLDKLDLKFLLEMSPWTVHCACHNHHRVKEGSVGGFLRSLLRLQVQEYMLRKNPELKEVESQLTDTIRNIGEIVYQESEQHQRIRSSANFKDHDLKIILAMGWLKFNGVESFVAIRPILIEVFIVEYLNYSIAELNLEDQMTRFNSLCEEKVDVVLGYSKGYFLKHMYLTHKKNSFVLSLSTGNKHEYKVQFHLYSDFQVLLQKIPTRYCIDITKTEDPKFQNLSPISPIYFRGEHFITGLLAACVYLNQISLKFLSNSTKSSSENTSILYTYSINVGFRYQFETKISEILPLAIFVKGINAILLNWKSNDLEPSVENLSIVCDAKNLTFLFKVLNIAFGFEASAEDYTSPSYFENLQNYMESHYDSRRYILETVNNVILTAFVNYTF